MTFGNQANVGGSYGGADGQPRRTWWRMRMRGDRKTFQRRRSNNLRAPSKEASVGSGASTSPHKELSLNDA